MRLGRNLIAGVGGSAWTALIGLAATPFYLRYLGVEAYGIIGVFVALQAIVSLLDIGLSPTLNREIARSLAAGRAADARHLLRSFASAGWSVAVGIAAALVLAAPALAEHWLRAGMLSPERIAFALGWAGIAIACRWPAALYLGALHGSQRLALAAALSAAYSTVAAGGSMVMLATVSPTIEAFFAWQAAAALAYSLSLRHAAWRTLGGVQGARAGFAPLRRSWRFSAGMGLIAITSVVFTQADKAVLSRLLDLEAFGRYSLATLLASGLYVVATPTFNAMFPRFSALVAAGDGHRLHELYGLGTRALCTLVFPTAAVLAYHATAVLELWTGDSGLAARTAPVLALLLAGTALHTVMYFPYALQLAHGRPRVTVAINLAMIATLVPVMIGLTVGYGERGAAAGWFALHSFHLFFGTWMTHRYLLWRGGTLWLARDVGVPLLLAIGTIVVGDAAGAGRIESPWLRLAACALLWVVPVIVSLATSPPLRRALVENMVIGRASWSRGGA